MGSYVEDANGERWREVYSYVDDEVSLIHTGATNQVGLDAVEFNTRHGPRARDAGRPDGPGDGIPGGGGRRDGSPGNAGGNDQPRLQRRRRHRPGWLLILSLPHLTE